MSTTEKKKKETAEYRELCLLMPEAVRKKAAEKSFTYSVQTARLWAWLSHAPAVLPYSYTTEAMADGRGNAPHPP